MIRRNKTISWPLRKKSAFRFSFSAMVILLSVLFFLTGCNTTPSGVSGSASGSEALSSSEDASAVTPTPEATPTEEIEDTIVGRFFGNLYKAKEVKPFTHNDIRALYIGAGGNLTKNIEIANKTTINAFVVDLKESNGVYFASKNELANQIGAVKVAYNIEELVKVCHANNIKLIGRIVCFKDYPLAAARPDLCIQDKDGNLIKYPMEGSKVFVSAYQKEVWQYNIDLAKEAVSYGFDEIQFDYIRFPICNKTIRASEHFGADGTVPTKIECITRFMQTAKAQIQDELGVPLSADIFGIVLTSKLDGQLTGQEWPTIGHLGLDTLSPMIYPSHYGKPTVMNGINFANPSADTHAFLNAVFKTETASEEAGFSHVRCYIQAFDYTQEQIFGQIQALNENGFTEYIYWNAAAKYNIEDMKTD